jgi:hypothetical protein
MIFTHAAHKPVNNNSCGPLRKKVGDSWSTRMDMIPPGAPDIPMPCLCPCLTSCYKGENITHTRNNGAPHRWCTADDMDRKEVSAQSFLTQELATVSYW